MDSQFFKSHLAKPAVAGAVGGLLLRSEAGGKHIGDFYVNSPYPGFNMLNGKKITPGILGVLLGVSTTFITEAFNQMVHDIDKKHRTSHFLSLSVHVFSAGLAWAMLPTLLTDNMLMSSQITLGKVGVVSEMAAQWMYESFVEELGELFT